MKALSLHQPYASAITLGLKRYETRSWFTKYRGPLVIHAALKEFKYNDYEREYFMEVCRQLKTVDCPHYALVYGCAVCVVDLVDCFRTIEIAPRLTQAQLFWGDFRDKDDKGRYRYAFQLENPRKLWPPKRIKGMQRFFEIPDEVLSYA